MKKNILFAVPLMAAVLVSACADSESGSTPPATQPYDITGKIDYAGKVISSAKVCLDVNNNGLADDGLCADINDNSYSFTSTKNPDYYPLVAFIKETDKQVKVKNTVSIAEYDSILYAPRGKTNTISIKTTLAKSLMDKDSKLTLATAEEKANNIIKKADKEETILTVYNKSLKSTDIDISKSIRGVVNVITDKLSKESKITSDTNISISQDEVDNADAEIKAEDEKLPEEPTKPDESSKTPLEKITAMLAEAEIKNSVENPVNLNEYFVKVRYGTEIAINSNAFGEYSNDNTLSQMSLLGQLGYKEEGWPSDNQGFEVFPDEEYQTGYTFSNYFGNEVQINPCKVDKANGIIYKPMVDKAINDKMEADMMQCAKDSGINMDNPSQEDKDKILKCMADSYYNNKDNIKIEKWYWTIDITKIKECN